MNTDRLNSDRLDTDRILSILKSESKQVSFKDIDKIDLFTEVNQEEPLKTLIEDPDGEDLKDSARINSHRPQPSLNTIHNSKHDIDTNLSHRQIPSITKLSIKSNFEDLSAIQKNPVINTQTPANGAPSTKSEIPVFKLPINLNIENMTVPDLPNDTSKNNSKDISPIKATSVHNNKVPLLDISQAKSDNEAKVAMKGKVLALFLGRSTDRNRTNSEGSRKDSTVRSNQQESSRFAEKFKKFAESVNQKEFKDIQLTAYESTVESRNRRVETITQLQRIFDCKFHNKKKYSDANLKKVELEGPFGIVWYVGDVNDGVPHGYGKQYLEDGTIYKGYFRRGAKCGRGKIF